MITKATWDQVHYLPQAYAACWPHDKPNPATSRCSFCGTRVQRAQNRDADGPTSTYAADARRQRMKQTHAGTAGPSAHSNMRKSKSARTHWNESLHPHAARKRALKIG
ncbi:hypothetical protein FB451DRAFT_1166296 [Mycena latifolia]|nr:hypothetical protein FB451DRAFT_1166296 [Mycena latifolia]